MISKSHHRPLEQKDTSYTQWILGFFRQLLTMESQTHNQKKFINSQTSGLVFANSKLMYYKLNTEGLEIKIHEGDKLDYHHISKKDFPEKIMMELYESDNMHLRLMDGKLGKTILIYFEGSNKKGYLMAYSGKGFVPFYGVNNNYMVHNIDANYKSTTLKALNEGTIFIKNINPTSTTIYRFIKRHDVYDSRNYQIVRKSACIDQVFHGAELFELKNYQVVFYYSRNGHTEFCTSNLNEGDCRGKRLKCERIFKNCNVKISEFISCKLLDTDTLLTLHKRNQMLMVQLYKKDIHQIPILANVLVWNEGMDNIIIFPMNKEYFLVLIQEGQKLHIKLFKTHNLEVVDYHICSFDSLDAMYDACLAAMRGTYSKEKTKRDTNNKRPHCQLVRESDLLSTTMHYTQSIKHQANFNGLFTTVKALSETWISAPTTDYSTKIDQIDTQDSNNKDISNSMAIKGTTLFAMKDTSEDEDEDEINAPLGTLDTKEIIKEHQHSNGIKENSNGQFSGDGENNYENEEKILEVRFTNFNIDTTTKEGATLTVAKSELDHLHINQKHELDCKTDPSTAALFHSTRSIISGENQEQTTDLLIKDMFNNNQLTTMDDVPEDEMDPNPVNKIPEKTLIDHYNEQKQSNARNIQEQSKKDESYMWASSSTISTQENSDFNLYSTQVTEQEIQCLQDSIECTISSPNQSQESNDESDDEEILTDELQRKINQTSLLHFDDLGYQINSSSSINISISNNDANTTNGNLGKLATENNAMNIAIIIPIVLVGVVFLIFLTKCIAHYCPQLKQCCKLNGIRTRAIDQNTELFIINNYNAHTDELDCTASSAEPLIDQPLTKIQNNKEEATNDDEKDQRARDAISRYR